MFLDKKFILTNELIKHLNIAQANISNAKKELESKGDFNTIQKMGMYNYTVMNTKSPNIPNNLNRPDIFGELTDLSDKLPLKILKEEYNLTEEDCETLGATKIKVQNKDWFRFPEEFVTKIKNAIPYVLDTNELNDCLKRKLIDGYTTLKENKHFTWYYLR